MLRFLVCSLLLNSKGQCIAESESAGAQSICIFSFLGNVKTIKLLHIYTLSLSVPIVHHS